MKIPWFHVAAVVLLACLIHIVVVLSVPYLASRNAWSRLSRLGETNRLLVLPPPSPTHQSIPFMAPDVRYAICRYDLSEGPVRLSTDIPDDLWLIAFYTPRGDNFYTISGGDIKRTRVEILITTTAEPVLETAIDGSEESDDLVTVAAPNETGLIMIRAPLHASAYAPRTELALSKASCGQRLVQTQPAQG